MFDSINPATNEVIWSGEETDEHEIVDIVSYAREAFESWSTTPLSDRLSYIRKFKDVLTNNRGIFEELISKETGKPLWESKTEVNAMIGKIALSIESYEKRCPTVVTQNKTNSSVIRYKPHGVIAVYGPFNLPGHLPNCHIVPALIAGNTVVFKPSELTPAVGELLFKLWVETGLPNGVINLVQGGPKVGSCLSGDDIDGLFFTGSSKVGKLLHEQFGGYPQRLLVLELGGNNPLIVHNVTDLKAAAYLTIQSAFITSGQRCVCARRLILPRCYKSYEFLTELVNMTKTVTVGSYTDVVEPFMGPMITENAAKSLMDVQKKLIDIGAEPVLPMVRNGAFLSPGIIDVTDIYCEDEEHFGPLLKVKFVDDFNSAIVEANNTKFGLSAGLLSDNSSDYDLFYKKSRAGIINWNNQITGASGASPFGGTGESGNHRPSGYFASDYCSAPIASIESTTVTLPTEITKGIKL